MGNKFLTSTGIMFNFDIISDEQISIYDISHHLSKVQRYNGALPLDITYSVAEHSINLCRFFLMRDERIAAIQALLHDGSEAYINDLVSGAKSGLIGYKNLEKQIQTFIYTKYKIDLSKDHLVKNADVRIILNEIEQMDSNKLHAHQQYAGNFTKLPDLWLTYNTKPSIVNKIFLNLATELEII